MPAVDHRAQAEDAARYKTVKTGREGVAAAQCRDDGRGSFLHVESPEVFKSQAEALGDLRGVKITVAQDVLADEAQARVGLEEAVEL